MNEHLILGYNAHLEVTPGQQFVELAVAVAMEQRFHLDGHLVPSLLKSHFTDGLGDSYIGNVQLAVANDADIRDMGDLLPNEFEDRTAEVAGDALVGLRPAQLLGQEGMIQPLPARREPVDATHRFHLITAGFLPVPGVRGQLWPLLAE